MEVYEVIGTRPYHHHEHGATFAARLPAAARNRAVARGQIRVLKPFVPVLPPGYRLPPDWADRKQTTEAPQGASLIERDGDGN